MKGARRLACRAELVRLGACVAALDWFDAQPKAGPRKLWHAVPRLDWMLWYVEATMPGSTSLRDLRTDLLLMGCAALVTRLVNDGHHRAARRLRRTAWCVLRHTPEAYARLRRALHDARRHTQGVPTGVVLDALRELHAPSAAHKFSRVVYDVAGGPPAINYARRYLLLARLPDPPA